MPFNSQKDLILNLLELYFLFEEIILLIYILNIVEITKASFSTKYKNLLLAKPESIFLLRVNQ